jgi:hypothetical protein
MRFSEPDVKKRQQLVYQHEKFIYGQTIGFVSNTINQYLCDVNY